MTIVTVEIDKDKDLSALKNWLAQSGLKFEIDEQDDFKYTDDLKAEVDKRFDEYKTGKVKLISAAESQQQIKQLLAKKGL
jgi:spore coat polysaccharide biosynthesis protein SpsF (cytidylyltransferase family)